MFRFKPIALTCLASAFCVSGALARPIFIKYDGIEGEAVTGTTFEPSAITSNLATIRITPGSGGAGKVSWSAVGQHSRPMESLSLNFTKIEFNTAVSGSSHAVGARVKVEGRTIDDAIWARWSVGPNGNISFNFGKSPDAPGSIRFLVKNNGNPSAQNTCTGDIFGCWVLAALCPQLECNIMCPELCGVAQWNARTDILGGVAIDVPLGGPSTFNLPDGTVVTGDELSVVLVPPAAGRADPMTLVGASTAFTGLNGLEIRRVSGELVCPPDIDGSGILSMADVFEYLNAFFAGEDVADFDNSGSIEITDVFAYLQAFFRGCQ